MSKEYYVYGKQNVQVPAHLNFGKYILDRLRSRSDQVALENGETGETLTYMELTQYAVNTSVYTALKNLGVKRGDIVAIGSEKRLELISTYFAIIFNGATYTPYDLNNGQGPSVKVVTDFQNGSAKHDIFYQAGAVSSDFKVVDLETRKSLGFNERGEICVKGPVLMKGYIGMAQSSFIDEQGFFNTGDLGYYDEDNYFYIVGRLKDIIVYNGDNVPPYMQLRGGVKFIDEIPKNPRGKILRQRLQEML